MPVTVWPVTLAATMERFGRLLLVIATVIGVAALHTIGHASVTTPDHHDRVVAAADLTAVTIAATPKPADDNGCDGDGCTHPVAGSAAQDASAWWDVCMAVLTVLAGALASGPSTAVRTAPVILLTHARRRSPAARIRSVGLALAAAAVSRT
jgi:hypothetical protein